MRKSRAITLTIVTAVAMTTAQAQAPDPVPPPEAHATDCEGILRNAGTGTRIPPNCVAHTHNGYSAARVGGFGAIAKVRQPGS